MSQPSQHFCLWLKADHGYPFGSMFPAFAMLYKFIVMQIKLVVVAVIVTVFVGYH